MNKAELENLGKALGIRWTHVLKADLKDLSLSWEKPLLDARFADARLAYLILKAVTRAYLRGRNLRMGNARNRRRHQAKEAMLIQMLVRYISQEKSFSHLPETEVNSLESFAVSLGLYPDLKDEAARILQEGKTNERE